MADDIVKQLIKLNYLDESFYGTRNFKNAKALVELDIASCAESLCTSRGYPASLAHRNSSGTPLEK